MITKNTMTVTVPQDSNKWKVESHEEAPHPKRPYKGKGKGHKKQSGRAPPTTSASQWETNPVCGGVKAYYERSLHIKYGYRQGVQTSFYESTPSTEDPMGNTISPGAPRSTGNARANIPDTLEECDNRGASGFSRILFKCFPGAQSIRRVESSNRLKTTERSHFCTSLLYVRNKLSSEYCKKSRLHVQKRSAGCLLSCTNYPDSRKYLRFAFKSKVYQF